MSGTKVKVGHVTYTARDGTMVPFAGEAGPPPADLEERLELSRRRGELVVEIGRIDARLAELTELARSRR